MWKCMLQLLLVYMQLPSSHMHAVSISITKAKYLWNKTPSSVRRWKQRQATKEEFENIAWACKDGVRKGQSWTRDKICNRSWIQQKDHYITSKKWNKENVGPWLNGVGDLMTAHIGTHWGTWCLLCLSLKVNQQGPPGLCAQGQGLERRGNTSSEGGSSQWLHERENLTYMWDMMGFTPARWQLSDI